MTERRKKNTDTKTIVRGLGFYSTTMDSNTVHIDVEDDWIVISDRYNTIGNIRV